MPDTNLDVDADSRCEPAVKVGLASLAADMPDRGVVMQGNAPAHDRVAITDASTGVGASPGGGAGDDHMSLHLRTLSNPVEHGPAVTLMVQITSAPTSPNAVLTHDKQHLVAAVRESLTKPSVLAGRTLNKTIYGTHPYGQTVTPETVESVTRDDIVRYYQINYTVKRAVIILIDAINRQEAEAITEQITRGLPADGATPSALPDVKMPLIKAETIHTPHPARQTTIILG